MFKSRWSKVLGILPLMGALAGLSGCNQPQGTDEEATDVGAAELAGTPAKDAKGKMDGMHARGPAMLLVAALHELTLTDAQKATIQAELDALKPDESAKPDHEAARKALADAVRSGKVDEAALAVKAPKPPMDPARFAKAIGVLHDTLSAAQRKELVEKVSARMEKFGGPEGKPEWKDRGAKGDREARGPKGDREARGPKGERGEHGPGMHGPLGHLLRGIELTDAQREAVKAAMEKAAPSEADREAMKASHEAMQKAMRERLQSFASDSFDANTFAKPPEGAPKMGPEAMFDRMVKVLAAVTPILDETQRAELAKRIEEAPMGPPHMGKGHKPHGDRAE